MAKKKITLLDHLIFCSGCKQRVRPEIVVDKTTKEEVEATGDVQKEYWDSYYNLNPDYEEPKTIKDTVSKEVIVSISEASYYDQENQILKCLTQNCGKKYLRLYPNKKGKEDIIPLSNEWFLFPIENPKEEEVFVIPEASYRVYCEAILAFNSKMRLACGLLLGATLESICIEEGIKKIVEDSKIEKRIEKGKYNQGDFILVSVSEMLPVLAKEKNIDLDYENLMSTITKARNDVAHRIANLEGTELKAGIHSLELLFEELYVESYKKRQKKQSIQSYKTTLDSGITNRRNRDAN